MCQEGIISVRQEAGPVEMPVQGCPRSWSEQHFWKSITGWVAVLPLNDQWCFLWCKMSFLCWIFGPLFFFLTVAMTTQSVYIHYWFDRCITLNQSMVFPGWNDIERLDRKSRLCVPFLLRNIHLLYWHFWPFFKRKWPPFFSFSFFYF